MRVSIAEGLKLMAGRANKTMTQLNRELGKKKASNLINVVNRNTLQTKLLERLAELCGYKVVLVPKNVEVDQGIEIRTDTCEVENEDDPSVAV